MLKIEEIGNGCFVKIQTRVHLVERIKLIDNRTCTLESYFCYSTKKTGKLYKNFSRNYFVDDIERRVKIPQKEEIIELKNRISKQYPAFDLTTFSFPKENIFPTGEDIERCIIEKEYLKKIIEEKERTIQILLKK